MAITAKFLADFDAFVASTKNAENSLKNLEGGAERLSTTFESVKGIAGTLAGAFGIAFSVGAVTNFVGRVFDAASTIHDMGLKLGISAEAVQGFKFAAEQAGSTLDTVGTAITRMNKNLAEGDKSTVRALADAGLQFSTIRGMKPEDAFLAITDAIAKMPDPMQQVAVGTALMGKGFADLLPAIKEGFRVAAEAASKMSNETIASLERAQDAWTELSTHVTIVSGNMIAAFIELPTHTKTATDEITSGWTSFAMFADNAMQFGVGVALAMSQAAGAAKTTKEAVAELPKPLVDTTGALQLLNDQLAADQLAAAAAAQAQKDLAAAVKEHGEVLKAVAKIETDTRTASYAGLLGLSAAQQTASQQHFEAESQAIGQIQDAQAKLHDVEMRASMDTTTYQIMKIWERADAEIAAFKGTEEQAAAHADLVLTLASYEAKGLTDVMAVAVDTMVSKAAAGLDQMVGLAQAAVTSLEMPSNVTFTNTPPPIGFGTGRYVDGVDTWGVQRRAAGGPVSSGQSYMVGERGPELFRPSSSGSIFPNGGGVTLHTTINVTQPLGTPAAIAAAVEDAMGRSLKSSGVRLPTQA